MLWIFVLAIMMPISLANCEDNSNNLANITWEHAVNSKAKLEAALKTDVQFLEADVIIGKLSTVAAAAAAPDAPTGDAAAQALADAAPATEGEENKDPKVGSKSGGAAAKDPIPIMAHPPAVTSDLSLDEFLNTVADFNSKNGNSPKGVKLDFKTIEAVEKSIESLKKPLKAPLWINADILAGPVKGKAVPVDAKKFFDAVKGGNHLDHATLSIGWTTHVENNNTTGNYSTDHVESMIKAINENIKDSAHPLTFPVRAVFAADSKDTLHKLYDDVSKTKNVTFTVWSGETDAPDLAKLQDFISSFGVEKVYVDVPKDLKDKLKLDGSSASAIAQFGLFNVLALAVALFLRNGMH